jgi:glycerol-3-phosphate acyltransferase PlsY
MFKGAAMVFTLTGILIAYIIGSMPTGYIFGKVLKGIDIREHGSGNVGATNVFRTVGKIPGIIVLVIDYLKGLAAVTVVPMLIIKIFPDAPLPGEKFYIFMGAAAIAGHIWTCFLKFKGGKGVATTAGVMSGLFPWIFLSGLVIWAIVFSISKYVSLASIAAAVSLPVLAVISGKDWTVVVFTGVLCMVGVYSHRSNIRRLIQGTESKIIKG